MRFCLGNLVLFFGGILLISACSSAKIPKRELTVNRWERIFFQPINKTTETANLLPLRETPVNANDMEIRIWRGFGLGPFEALILKRSSAEWSAVHIVSDAYEPEGKTSISQLKTPKGGWNSFWN